MSSSVAMEKLHADKLSIRSQMSLPSASHAEKHCEDVQSLQLPLPTLTGVDTLVDGDGFEREADSVFNGGSLSYDGKFRIRKLVLLLVFISLEKRVYWAAMLPTVTWK